jgi:hypothetical protein
MSYCTTTQFAAKLRQILCRAPDYLHSVQSDSAYVDLNRVRALTSADMAYFSVLPEENPLNEAAYYIIKAAREDLLEHLNTGCNELLKSYLLQVNRENQELYTEAYCTQIQRIFIWCLDHPFIYLSHFWLYLIDCLHVTTHYILDQEYFQGALILINNLGLLGQGAVKHGLSTQRLQRLLRTLEVKSEEMGWIHGSRECRQQRHDIEVI